jgi:lipopolysaccharide export system ATP-binding protein
MSGDRATIIPFGAPSGEDVLLLDNVTFARHSASSGHLSLRVGCGEIVGLLGPAGAGKTSLLRVIAGESRPIAGKIWAQQREITGLGHQAAQDAGVFVCLHDRHLLRANRSMLEIVAIAVQSRPKVLVVDEPFHRLEDTLPGRALISLFEACRHAGTSVLFTDHDVRRALPLVQRAYIIHEGKILVDGTPEYLTTPQDY